MSPIDDFGIDKKKMSESLEKIETFYDELTRSERVHIEMECREIKLEELPVKQLKVGDYIQFDERGPAKLITSIHIEWENRNHGE